MALRRSLEAHLSISGLCSPNGSPAASGSSFSAFLGPADQIALRRLLEVHFEHFWGPLAQMALRRSLEPHFEHFWNLLAISGFRLRENMDSVRSTSIKTNQRSLMFGAER